MINWAVNKLLVVPVNKIGTSIKRKPWLWLLLLIVLWFLPLFSFFAAQAVGWILALVLKLFGEPAAKALSGLFNRLFKDNSTVGCKIGLLILPLTPVLGATIIAWCMVDKLKTYVAERRAPATQPVNVEKPTG